MSSNIQSRVERTRILIVLPTFNERENLGAIVPQILNALPTAHLWIVDDNSPDGTGIIADEIASQDERILVFHRPGKLGLGTAYAWSFQQALQAGYDYVLEMDADFSHDPRALTGLMRKACTADLVLGSRYVTGGSTPDWSVARRLISRTGNIVARTVLRMPIRDSTTGYRVFNRRALASLHLDAMKLEGYGFQIETVYQCHQAGLRIIEHPITFVDRQHGESKMSSAIALEALLYVLRRRLNLSTSSARRYANQESDFERIVEATRLSS